MNPHTYTHTQISQNWKAKLLKIFNNIYEIPYKNSNIGLTTQYSENTWMNTNITIRNVLLYKIRRTNNVYF